MILTPDQCSAPLPAGRGTLVAQARFAQGVAVDEHAVRLIAELMPRHQRQPASRVPAPYSAEQDQEP